ncbi:sugar ABC transporter ATP-binding protein [Psychromonas sp. psych-6C06]|uniref:ABC transporter ATP-binding protein n=1 Tax=Psychromonas sp. psych-6C06 TaxID=2058089 RepID=UPI000C31E20C|nr:ABC transporter ATP-binding protein [Psychromonas sp. psych-6C06]PKF61608.1 sugar ABC transporter ATP-binding protein [Psychromonas sp. psych-6C06]
MQSDKQEKPLLQVKDLVVEYVTDDGAFRAVNEVSFDIAPGEVFGLAGESGCGKSTIAFAITRLQKPPAIIPSGEIFYKGTNLLNLSDSELQAYRWTQIAMVFQSAMNSLNPVISIEEQFCDVILAHTNMSRSDAIERAKKLMDVVKIPRERIRDYPHQFSGGMRQRLVIAICLVLNAKLIVMDEPTTALDVVVQREILQQIYQLKDEFGFSILFITHDLSLMAQFCDRIGIMYQGKLVEVNDAQEIRNYPRHPYTKKLWSAFPSIHEGRKNYQANSDFIPKIVNA